MDYSYDQIKNYLRLCKTRDISLIHTISSEIQKSTNFSEIVGLYGVTENDIDSIKFIMDSDLKSVDSTPNDKLEFIYNKYQSITAKRGGTKKKPKAKKTSTGSIFGKLFGAVAPPGIKSINKLAPKSVNLITDHAKTQITSATNNIKSKTQQIASNTVGNIPGDISNLKPLIKQIVKEEIAELREQVADLTRMTKRLKSNTEIIMMHEIDKNKNPDQSGGNMTSDAQICGKDNIEMSFNTSTMHDDNEKCGCARQI